MFNIVRWYNQNRKKFWTTILVIFFIIFFIQTINSIYRQKQKPIQDTKDLDTVNIINNKISGTLESTTSLIKGNNVSKEYLEKETLVIDNFIKHCNNGEIQEAYNLLTDECKEELYTSLESFTNKYYNKVFKTYKTYSIQNWEGYIYKLKLAEDALTTGKASTNSSYFQEYITVVNNNSKYRLNINNYIGRTKLNKTTNVNKITVNAIKKEEYIDYSKYTVKIQNNTNNTILLDNMKKTNTIYLLDRNNIKEYANTGEIIDSTLKLIPGESRTYEFKFSNSYSNTREMTHLVLENVIMNYDEMVENNNYDNFTKISVNV